MNPNADSEGIRVMKLFNTIRSLTLTPALVAHKCTAIIGEDKLIEYNDNGDIAAQLGVSLNSA